MKRTFGVRCGAAACDSAKPHLRQNVPAQRSRTIACITSRTTRRGIFGEQPDTIDVKPWIKLGWESSPDASVAKWRSPVLLIQGDDDPDVSFHQLVDLVPRLQQYHVPYQLLAFPDEGSHSTYGLLEWSGSASRTRGVQTYDRSRTRRARAIPWLYADLKERARLLDTYFLAADRRRCRQRIRDIVHHPGNASIALGEWTPERS